MAAPRKDLVVDDAVEELVARYRRTLEAGDETLARLERDRAAIVRELRARDPEPSWTAIGELLGMTGERARQLANERTRS